MRNWLLSLILMAPPIIPAFDASVEGVEILRDPRGVPHVLADAEEAGFFGRGVCLCRGPAVADGPGASE